MSLPAEEVVWIFDGRDGLRQMLGQLVSEYLVAVQALMPPSARKPFNDPLRSLAADAGFHALDQISGLQLKRLFPMPVARELDEGREAAEEMARSRAATMHGTAHVVLASLEEHGDFVPVSERDVTAWLQTLGALRTSLHAKLAESPQRQAEPTKAQLAANPALAAVLDWLAYSIEDLLVTRAACQQAGTGLDVTDIKEWE